MHVCIYVRDYMDRFLDENESAASSRASSPHHFAGRPRPAMNGVAPTTVQGPVQAPGTVQQTVAIPTASQHTTVVISGAGISSVTPSNGIQLGQPNNTQGGQLAQQYVPTSVIVASQDRAEPPQKKPRMDLQNRPKLISSKPPPLKPIAMSDFRSTNMLTAGPTKPIHISLSSSSPSPSPSSHERSFGSNHMPNLTTPESPLYTQNNWDVHLIQGIYCQKTTGAVAIIEEPTCTVQGQKWLQIWTEHQFHCLFKSKRFVLAHKTLFCLWFTCRAIQLQLSKTDILNSPNFPVMSDVIIDC